MIKSINVNKMWNLFGGCIYEYNLDSPVVVYLVCRWDVKHVVVLIQYFNTYV
jgi:hypothetical protein